ncbi:MAG TPA: polysaccharide deacetylase family protein [Streptosporangiaceae bacterium]|nr:polysaccharide deacetylase family protein [Streptosporangiaceae bacterium]
MNIPRPRRRRVRTPILSRRLAYAAIPLLAIIVSACGSNSPMPASALPHAAQAAVATPPLPSALGGTEWTAVKTSSKVVALTFDAGANADGVSSILSTLSTSKVPATFFLTGNFVRDFPAQSRAIARAGERIGDHSINHPYFTKLTDAQMKDQVLSAQKQITAATGVNPWPWFRFPYGDRNAHTISVVNSVGFVPIGWTVDTLGWEGADAGITVASVVNRVVANLKPGEIVLMHCGSANDHSTLDADALPAIIKELRSRGYSFVSLDAMLGYRILSSNGDVSAYGSASFGSALGKLASGVTTVGIAADRGTGGYWMVKSNGGIGGYNAPWIGSLAGKLPAGIRATGIAAGYNNGYLILTSDGGVHPFARPWFGSDAGKLPTGVTAVGLAINSATGGYWIVRSDGRVDGFNAPWLGSLAGQVPSGIRVTGIAAASAGGYYLLTSNGDVHAFGTTWYGSVLGGLPTGVTTVAITPDLATGGYWVLKSNGGIAGFNAPWWGSLVGKLRTGQKVTGIAGQ